MPSTATKQTVIVTKEELLLLADLESECGKAETKLRDLKRSLDFHRLSLAEKVLGVKSADEFKHLSPQEVEKLYAKRLTRGDWKAERSAPRFVFLKTSQGRYPAWRRLFADLKGETAAAEIQESTPVIYSYAVQVTTQ